MDALYTLLIEKVAVVTIFEILNNEGKWEMPVNMGEKLIISFEEQSPLRHPDNQTLYFSLDGWPGLGSRDSFIEIILLEIGRYQ
jgi:hypothetical protein